MGEIEWVDPTAKKGQPRKLHDNSYNSVDSAYKSFPRGYRVGDRLYHSSTSEPSDLSKYLPSESHISPKKITLKPKPIYLGSQPSKLSSYFEHNDNIPVQVPASAPVQARATTKSSLITLTPEEVKYAIGNFFDTFTSGDVHRYDLIRDHVFPSNFFIYWDTLEKLSLPVPPKPFNPVPEEFAEIHTIESWNALTTQERLEHWSYYAQEKKKSSRGRPKTKNDTPKIPKRDMRIFIDSKEFHNIDFVPLPDVVRVRLMRELTLIKLKLPVKTLTREMKIIYAYEQFLEHCDEHFTIVEGVKHITDELNLIGKNLYISHKCIYRGDLDPIRRRKTDEFFARVKKCTMITITTFQTGRGLLEQKDLLLSAIKTLKPLIKKNHKGCSIYQIITHHSTGYKHCHLVCDFILTPEEQDALRKKYVEIGAGDYERGLNFINYRGNNPLYPNFRDMKYEYEHVEVCKNYMHKNISHDDMEASIISKKVSDAITWYSCKPNNPECTSFRTFLMSGPVADDVCAILKSEKPEPFKGKIHRLVKVKNYIHERVVWDVKEKKYPKKRIDELVDVISKTPWLVKYYHKMGITDPRVIAEKHWYAQYADDIAAGEVKDAERNEILVKVQSLSEINKAVYRHWLWTHLGDHKKAYENTVTQRAGLKWYNENRLIPHLLQLHPHLKVTRQIYDLSGKPAGTYTEYL